MLSSNTTYKKQERGFMGKKRLFLVISLIAFSSFLSATLTETYYYCTNNKIWLLADLHNEEEFTITDKLHQRVLKESLLLSQNKTPDPKELIILIEDQHELKTFKLSKKKSFLGGLVQELKSLSLKKTTIENCDPREISRLAINFFNYERFPPSCAFSPLNVSSKKKPNLYSFTFQNLIDEFNNFLLSYKKIKENLSRGLDRTHVI
jgi:hypothetical protein